MTYNVKFDQSNLQDGFWKEKQELFQRVTIDAVYTQFQNSGRMEAIKLTWKEDAATKSGMPNGGDAQETSKMSEEAKISEKPAAPPKPDIFWESDVTKWIEGAAYFLTKHRDTALETKIDEIVSDLEKAQGEDGYLNEYFTVVEPDARFERRGAHELYCAGHLIEGAIAYDYATGKDKMLQVAMRYADYIDQVFRINHAAAFDTPGHEEIELALVKLYLYTGKENYRKLSEYFVDTRGNSSKDTTYGRFDLEHIQGHLPVREQKTMEGHSVRALYLLCAMADLAFINQDETLTKSCKILYDNITQKRMYITGGIGSTHEGESFTYDYDLPEYTGYCETCASIALALFCRRMWLLDLDGKYADIAERAIYNTVLSGISLSGDEFFYENPLSTDMADWEFNQSRPETLRKHMALPKRVRIFTCSCCPPNLIRLVGSIADYMYTVDQNTIYTQCYVAADTTLTVAEQEVTLHQTTAYPYDGRVQIVIDGEGTFTFALRIPGWCEQTDILVNDQPVEQKLEKGYVKLAKQWKKGDCITLDFKMEVQFITANPKVASVCGRTAVTKGPLVYCAEEIDHEERSLRDIRISREAEYKTQWEKIAGVNIPVIVAEAEHRKAFDQLYTAKKTQLEAVKMKFIPYFARANRGACEMTTWFLEKGI